MKIYQCDMCKRNFTFKLPAKITNNITDSQRMRELDICDNCFSKVLSYIAAEQPEQPTAPTSEMRGLQHPNTDDDQ